MLRGQLEDAEQFIHEATGAFNDATRRNVGAERRIRKLQRKLRATRGEHDECAIEDCSEQALPGDDCCLRCWAEETDPELFARREAEREQKRQAWAAFASDDWSIEALKRYVAKETSDDSRP